MEWIPVSERLPERNGLEAQSVIAANDRGVFVTSTHPSWWNTKDGRDPEFDGPVVTHWMPLPEPPK